MSPRPSPRLPFQLFLWAAGNSVAGAAVGLAVGIIQRGEFEFPVVLIGVLFGNVVGFTVLVSSVVLFSRLASWSPPIRMLMLGIFLFSGSVAGSVLVLYLFPLFILRDLRQAVGIVGINGVLALMVGSVVYAYEGMRLRLAASLREIEEVRLVEARLREQAARAELAALQARINPHFFFNTLNTISSLLEESPEEAGVMVQTLADLFRYTFKVVDADPVPLSEELRFLEGYLAIESARFGDRLRVTWNIEEEVRRARIPGLLLQPLVENAVGHGLAPSPRGGTVWISAARREGKLEIIIRDDGVGLKRNPAWEAEGTHGLDNVRQRIQSAYGDQASLRLESDPREGGTWVRLLLPLVLPAIDSKPRRTATAAGLAPGSENS